MQSRIVIRKLKKVKAKLETALEEWLLVVRFVETFRALRTGRDGWQKTMQDMVNLDKVRAHVKYIEEGLVLAEERLLVETTDQMNLQ